MFNKNNEVESLKGKLQQLTDDMLEMSKARDDIYVVKIYPENPDQFELNGEFIVDESRAIYGSHKLTTSEAVLFKAGKEVATKQFEADKFKIEQELQLKISECKGLEARALEAESLYEEEKRKSFKSISDLNAKCNELEEEKLQFSATLEDCRDEIERIKMEYDNRVAWLNEIADYWKDKYHRKAPEVDTQGNVKTRFGEILDKEN